MDNRAVISMMTAIHTVTQRPWSPILTGARRAQAAAAVREIVAAVSRRSDAASGDASLAGGSAGLAVYYAYLARSGFADECTAMECVENAMDAVSAVPMGSSLHGGITGLAWAMAHLRGWLVDDDDDATAEVDKLLLKHLERQPWRGDYDLIGGLVGIGVYALEQLPSASALECLRRVVERLDEMAERTADRITWFTAPELLPEWQRQACPHGYYNLGVAHGVPGVIALLAHVCAHHATGSGANHLGEKARVL